MWTVTITCLNCREVFRTKHHQRCTCLCTTQFHYDWCQKCQKKLSELFDRALVPYVYIRTEEDSA